MRRFNDWSESKAVAWFCIIILGLLAAGIARAGVTVSVKQGQWDLYRGTSIASAGHASEAECVAAAKALNVSRAYTCRTRTGVTVLVTVDTPPPPPPDPTPDPTPIPDPTPPPSGDVVYASPPTADTSNLKPGQMLVLKDGTYTSLKLKTCSADAWCVVRAETDGKAVLTSLNIGSGNWYTSIEGLKVTGSSSKVVTGSFVTFRRVAFEGGPSTGNDVSVQLGTNDKTPGCSNITIEDSWVYGLGGRYKLLVYNCDTVNLTRVVVRHDGGWKYDSRNPQGGFSIYDSKNVTANGIACVDSVQGLSGFEACIYLVSNGTTATKQSNVTINGAIVIDSPNNGLAAEGNGSAATYTINDLLVLNSAAGGINTNNSGHVINANRVTCSVKGVCFGKWASGGSIKVNNCKFGKGTLSSGASLTNCPGGSGADLSSFLPWPNEARIKADFDSVRPAFGGKSLTEYMKQ